MRLPNWIWPKVRNTESGFAGRLGRLLHWLCSISAAGLIILAAALAVSAVLSSPAKAQGASTENAAQNSQEDKISPADVVWDQPAKTPELKTKNAAVPPTIADTVDQIPDLRRVQIGTKPIDEASKPNVDWALLQFSGALFVGGILLAMLGRGLRYLLADE